MLYQSKFNVSLCLTILQILQTSLAHADDSLISNSFATATALHHPPPLLGPDSRDLPTIRLDNAGPLEALANQSSFPTRIVNVSEEDSWENLPSTVEQPKPLERLYGAYNCRFYLHTQTYTVSLKQSDGERFINTKDAIGKQSIINLDDALPHALAVASELRVKLKPGTEQACQKIFSGKKIRFAQISLTGGDLYLLNRAGDRFETHAITEAESTTAYLMWDDSTNTLQISDRGGLAIAITSGVYTMPNLEQGIYYLAYEPAWEIKRFSRNLAGN